MTYKIIKKAFSNNMILAALVVSSFSSASYALPKYEMGFDGDELSDRWITVGREGEIVTEIGGREGDSSYKFTIGTNAEKITLKELEKSSVSSVSALRPVDVRSAINIEGNQRWYGFSVFVPHKYVADSRSEDTFFMLDSDKRLPSESVPFKIGLQGGRMQVTIVGGSKGEVVTGYKKKENPPKINKKNKKIYEMLAGKKNLNALNYDQEREVKYLSKFTEPFARAKAGAWHDIVIYMKTGYRNDAFVYIYVNGKEEFKHKGPIALKLDDDMYVKFGLWRDKWNNKEAYIKDAKRGVISRSLYFDSFRTGVKGNQYSDVMPGRGVADGIGEYVARFRPDGKIPVLEPQKLTQQEVRRFMSDELIALAESKGVLEPLKPGEVGRVLPKNKPKPEDEGVVGGFVSGVKSLFSR